MDTEQKTSVCNNSSHETQTMELVDSEEGKSVFDDPFFKYLLAVGEIDGQENIPIRLLEAMAILVARSADCYFAPMDCRQVAALVVLAFGLDLMDLPRMQQEPHLLTRQKFDRYK